MHADFLRLERELGDCIAQVRSGTDLPRILVLATTRRQVARLNRILAERFHGLLGVRVTTHLGYVFQVLENEVVSEDLEQVEAVDRPLREALVERLLASSAATPLQKYAAEYSNVASSLGSLFGELREARVTPDQFIQSAGSDWESSIAVLYADYEASLQRLQKAGTVWRDRAGMTDLAAQTAAQQPPFDLVVQYGTSELVGMNLHLVSRLPARQKLWLIPCDRAAPSWAKARSFAQKYLPQDVQHLEADSSRPLLDAARALGEWRHSPPQIPPAAATLIHAQGPDAELTAAARWALSRIEHGMDPSSIAIIARSLTPYDSTADAVFRRHGLPLDTTSGRPLSRQPRAHGLLTWLRVLENDFERSAMVDLMRAPALRRQKKGSGWWPDQWDRWSRKYNIAQGAENWKAIGGFVAQEELSEELQRVFLNSAETLSDFVDSLLEDRGAWKKCKTAGDHAEFIADRGSKRIRPVNDKLQEEISGSIASVLDALRSLDVAYVAAGGEVELSTHEVLRFIERTMQSTSIAVSQTGGVAFLDVMQSRGLVFDEIYFVGFNTGMAPNPRVENIFLSDKTRERIAEQFGVPLNTRRASALEEKQILAQTVAQAQNHLVLSWQRADAEGKSKAVSLGLQDWCRILPGPANIPDRAKAPPPQGPLRVPTNPAKLADFYIKWLGFSAPVDSALALAQENRFAARETVFDFWHRLEPESQDLRTALNPFIRDIQSRRPSGSVYDGYPGAEFRYQRPFSPSSLQTVGVCPTQFFFKHVLRLRALDDSSEDTDVDDMTLGRLIHQVLEDIYSSLAGDGGVINAKDTDLAPLVRKCWDKRMEDVGRRMASYAELWKSLQNLWLKEILQFVAKDLERIHGQVLIGTEREYTRELELPLPGGRAPIHITLTGRLDRITQDGDTLVVSDYKTGGYLDKWVSHTAYLRGGKLQLPLYQLLVQTKEPQPVKAELLGLGPKFFPRSGFVRQGPVALPAKYREQGLLETIAVLAETVANNRFPLSIGRHCSYCDFRGACRRDHYTSRERVANDPANEEYFLLKEKTASASTIDILRSKQNASS